MLRIQPLSFTADGPDQYRVRCQSDRGEDVEYTFSIRNFGEGRRSLSHEDAFYFVTYDDPAAEWLERSIQAFDRARQSGFVPDCQAAQMQPLSLVVSGEDQAGRHQYRLVFESNGRETEHILTVTDKDDTRIVSWEYGSCEAKLNDGFWEFTDPDADSLLESVLMIHQAMHPKYSLEKGR